MEKNGMGKDIIITEEKNSKLIMEKDILKNIIAILFH